jgi:hypothetical protein
VRGWLAEHGCDEAGWVRIAHASGETAISWPRSD